MRTVETVADQLFFTTVYIEAAAPGGVSTGTGFVVSYHTPEGILPILITNKHVLGDFSEITFRMVAAETGAPSKHATQITVSGVVPGQTWVGHPDPNVDIAVMPFGEVMTAMANNGAPPYFRAFGPEDFLTQEQADELDGIEQVLFVGYPNGLFDTASWMPIVRRGQTATPIYNDYRGQPSFLIDASVFPGSSGSPVVIYDRGMYVTRTGATNIGSRFYLAGVVAAVHTRQVLGQIILTQGTPAATFSDMIDLGIVYKAGAIQETVDVLVQSKGIQLESPPSAETLA